MREREKKRVLHSDCCFSKRLLENTQLPDWRSKTNKNQATSCVQTIFMYSRRFSKAGTRSSYMPQAGSPKHRLISLCHIQHDDFFSQLKNFSVVDIRSSSSRKYFRRRFFLSSFRPVSSVYCSTASVTSVTPLVTGLFSKCDFFNCP